MSNLNQLVFQLWFQFTDNLEDTLLQEFVFLGKYEPFTDFIEDASWGEKCEECARRALSALFPDENVADVHSIFERDYFFRLIGSAMELADRYGHLADVMEKGTSLLDALTRQAWFFLLGCDSYRLQTSTKKKISEKIKLF